MKFLETLYALHLKKTGIENKPEAQTELEFYSRKRLSQYFFLLLVDSCKAELLILSIIFEHFHTTLHHFASNCLSLVTECFGMLNDLEGLVLCIHLPELSISLSLN